MRLVGADQKQYLRKLPTVKTRLEDPKNGNSAVTMMTVAPAIARPSLSDREIEVLRTWLICDSKDVAARRLFITAATVNTHITRIRDKYDLVNRSAATKSTLLARAIQDGHITVDEL